MAQAGFPLTREEEELINSEDAQMGRPTARYLHPAISEFIADMQAELTSMGQLPTTLEQAAIDLEEGWSHKHVTGGGRITGSPDNCTNTSNVTCPQNCSRSDLRPGAPVPPAAYRIERTIIPTS
jgi:hypothetical protein